jgi:hypothetical protein
MRCVSWLRITCLVLLALAFSQRALLADTIYTNFDAGGSYAAGAGLIISSDPISGASVAVAFTPSDNFNLTSIEFVVSDLIPDDSNDITLGIFADNGGQPDAAALESFSVTPLGMFGDNLLVTTVSSILQPLLFANTQYWIGMSAAPGDLVIWNQNVMSANGFSETDGAGNWSAADSLQPQGVLEVDGAVAYVPPAVADEGLPSSLPEPAAWLLMAGGLVALAFLRRRFRTVSGSNTSALPRP